MWPDWTGRTVYVIASGASAPAAVAKLVRPVTAIAVNRAFELAPWADVLYSADDRFWKHYPEAHDFVGLKLSADLVPGVRQIAIAYDENDISEVPVFDEVGTVGGGGNSGFQAVNLAAQFGARRIVLVGFDMGGKHWHADHTAPLPNPRDSTLAAWRQDMDDAAPIYAARGIEILNASRTSALTAYPLTDLESAQCSP